MRFSVLRGKSTDIILAAAVLTHALFALTPIRTYDTLSYIATAAAFPPWGGGRLPLYPALLSIAQTFSSFEATVWFAVGLSAPACWAIMRLTRVFSSRAAPIAGLLFAFSPSSLSFVNVLLPEALAGYCCVIAVACAVDRRYRWAILCMAVAQLARPHLAPIGVLMALMALVTGVPRRQAAMLLAAGLILPLGICTYNALANGRFTLSTTDAGNMGAYFAARIEGGDNSTGMLAVQARVIADAPSDDLNAQAAYYNAYARDVFARAGVVTVLGVLMRETGLQVFYPPVFGAAEAVLPWVFAYWLVFLLMAVVGTIRLLLKADYRGLILLMTFAAFCVPGALLAGWSGARLRQTGDLFLIPLAALAWRVR